jgi:glycosyltransferase involved in cell wall biosynthesis
VQVEAMLKGTPVVTTDLPGVRVAVRATGMGEIVPPRDSEALATAIIKVLENRERYVIPAEKVEQIFDPQKTYDFYEDLFAAALGLNHWDSDDRGTPARDDGGGG